MSRSEGKSRDCDKCELFATIRTFAHPQPVFSLNSSLCTLNSWSEGFPASPLHMRVLIR